MVEQTARVKPAPRADGDGPRLVRDPYTGKPLPAEGAVVPLSTYWRRRLLQGDVVRVTESSARKARKDETK